MKAQLSRNKREGYYAGTYEGKHIRFGCKKLKSVNKWRTATSVIVFI